MSKLTKVVCLKPLKNQQPIRCEVQGKEIFLSEGEIVEIPLENKYFASLNGANYFKPYVEEEVTTEIPAAETVETPVQAKKTSKKKSKS